MKRQEKGKKKSPAKRGGAALVPARGKVTGQVDASGLYRGVRAILDEARGRAARPVNVEMVGAYWLVGQAIVNPVSFVAQAPGELTLTEWQIGFEAVPGTRPPVPPSGLCAPTPLGALAGESGDDQGFCKCCRSQQPVTNASRMVTNQGTPAMVGQCATCGDDMISFGGRPVPGAQRLTALGMSRPHPIFKVATRVEARPTQIEPAPLPSEDAGRQQAIQPLLGQPAREEPARKEPVAEKPTAEEPAPAELPSITAVKILLKIRSY